MIIKDSDGMTADEVARLLRDAGAPECSHPDCAYHRFASIMTLRMAYPATREQCTSNPTAVKLDRAAASLRRTLPEYVDFWTIAEDLPNFPESAKERLRNLRQLAHLLDELFPIRQVNRKRNRARWQQVGPDEFEYHAATEWHEFALYLFACYQHVIDSSSGISRDGAAVRFIRAVLERCGVGHFTLDAIEKALSRAKKAIPCVTEPT
jgi:hypothetical protein